MLKANLESNKTRLYNLNVESLDMENRNAYSDYTAVAVPT